MGGVSEHRLIHAARRGDIQAFTELARRYQERIYRAIYWLVKDHQDADDLAQEVFLHAFKHVKGFRQRSSFYTWIYRIAMNLTFNFLKKKKRERGRTFLLEGEVPDTAGTPGVNPSPEAISSGNELRKKLEEALDSLPLPYRASFILVVFQEMSHEEASQVLGCSANTVSWRMFKARKMLQERLHSIWGGDEG